MTLRELLHESGLPRNEALLLAACVSGRERAWLLAHDDELLTDERTRDLLDRFERRRRGEPIAYLVGTRAFFGRRFDVDARVLIPRPETELLVEIALADRRPTRVLDLGTGSGVIAITLALEMPGTSVVATDVSIEALVVARANAGRLDAPVRFLAGDWYEALPDDDAFDLIVSNPPYIRRDDRHLAEGDLRFEPRDALTDGHDGLAAIRRIVEGAPRRLHDDGMLMIEHGYDQGPASRALFHSAGFIDVVTACDLAGHERATSGRRASSRPV